MHKNTCRYTSSDLASLGHLLLKEKPFLQSAAMGAIISLTKVRRRYEKGAFCLPREDLSQVTDAKLYNAIPPFATGLPHLYYSHTTFENNHLLPQHDTK